MNTHTCTVHSIDIQYIQTDTVYNHNMCIQYLQGVPGGMEKFRESVPYVKIYRYDPKHLRPKLNGYGDKGQRKLWSLCGST